jgi:hypothetical protein
VDNEDEFPSESAGVFSAGGARVDTEDGYAIIVHVDRATGLATLGLEDSEGALVDSRVLDADDLERLHDALAAAREYARTHDVPVALDVSAVIGRD